MKPFKFSSSFHWLNLLFFLLSVDYVIFETECPETGRGTQAGFSPALSRKNLGFLVTEKKPKQSVSNIVNTDCAYDRYAHISHATYA